MKRKSQQAAFDFSVVLMPSMTHAGQHAISLMNGDKETILLGFTSDVIGTKEAFSKLFTKGRWTEDTDMRVHVMDISVSEGIISSD